jgi:hypothetical protein
VHASCAPFNAFADVDADLVLPHDKKFLPAANLTDDEAQEKPECVLDEQSDDDIDNGTAENQAEDCVSNDDVGEIVSQSKGEESDPEVSSDGEGPSESDELEEKDWAPPPSTCTPSGYVVDCAVPTIRPTSSAATLHDRQGLFRFLKHSRLDARKWFLGQITHKSPSKAEERKGCNIVIQLKATRTENQLKRFLAMQLAAVCYTYSWILLKPQDFPD